MRRAILTHEAKCDLHSIYQYIKTQSGSKETAQRFINRLHAKCEHIATLPLPIGTPRPDLAPDIHAYSFGNYLIFYRYHEEVMEVAVITEGHREIEGLFKP